MNVVRAALNKKSRGRGGRFKHIQDFNTYFQGTLGKQVSNHLSSSNFSSVTQPGKVLGTAQRNSSNSHSSSSPLYTPNLNLAFGGKPVSKEPHITNEFLEETFCNLDVPLATSSSNSKLSNHTDPLLRSLPPPNSAVIIRKPRSATSSGVQPRSTPSHSRTPRTPKTVSSCVDSNHCMTLAITEGRGLARGEVGIAAMDVNRPHLIMCQMSDSQTYVNTITKINIIHPVEILVPATFVDSQSSNKLFELVLENFPQVTITTVQRRHFNDAVGLQQVRSLCLPEYTNVQLVVGQKFYALAAVAALLKYVEFMKNILFAPKSLKIDYQSPENVMSIDMGTASRLELVMPRRGTDKHASLLGVLDHCSTTSGKRSLRANILQPPTVLEVIQGRLLSVTELSQNPALLHSLQTAVSKFQNVEQLLWLCFQVRSFQNDRSASEMQTNYILLLKTTLESLPHLSEALQSAQTPYFHKVLKDLADKRFNQLLSTILEVINDDARTKNGYAASQFQRCFAIKTEVSGLLDVSRSAYSELVSTMHGTVQKLAEEFKLPLRAVTTGNKGFHIQLNVTRRSGFSAKDLPAVFIQVSRSRNLITCTTEELVVLNHRMRNLITEIQFLSNKIIQELISKLREHVSCLYRLCEDIAELDLLVSLAQVSSAYRFVKPTFGDCMNIKESRHPILDFISPSTPVPNDIFSSKEKNFHIITGPNMGGKSIYIRQVALLQIMAQIGCYVPAETAEFRITKQIFSRLGFDDSIEYNASSFVLEIKEMQYILQSLGPRSLVVIDELCRSTDHEEGTAIAWEFCEQLLKTTAFTFFTTHFLYLTRLQRAFPNVTNHHMVTEENAEGRLVYKHRLDTGVTRVTLYGLRLAQNCNLPTSLLQHAQQICSDLVQQRLGDETECFLDEDDDINEDKMYVDELLNLIKRDKFNLEEVKKIQEKLKIRYNIGTAKNVEEENILVNEDDRDNNEDESERLLQIHQDQNMSFYSPPRKRSLVQSCSNMSPYESSVSSKTVSSDAPHEFRTPTLPDKYVVSGNKTNGSGSKSTARNDPSKSPLLFNMSHSLKTPAHPIFSDSYEHPVSSIQLTSPTVPRLLPARGSFESPGTLKRQQFPDNPDIHDNCSHSPVINLKQANEKSSFINKLASPFQITPSRNASECKSYVRKSSTCSRPNFNTNSPPNVQSPPEIDNTEDCRYARCSNRFGTHFSEEVINHKHVGSPYTRPSSLPSYLSARVGHQNQTSPFRNNSPMVVEVIPDFETVPRNMTDDCIEFDDDKDMFEE